MWRPVRRGVYAVNGSPRSWMQEVRAALLASGPGVAAAFTTALRLYGCPVPLVHRDAIHVAGPLSRVIRLPGVIAHRSGTFADGDLTRRSGIPCTSALRTVVDVSGMLGVDDLGAAVDDLMRRRLLRLEALRERVALVRPAPGRSVKKLRIVLAQRIPGYDPGESPLEARLARLIDAGRIVRPVQQHRVRLGGARYRLDFAWPDRKIYLEGNGFGCHSIASDLDSDARRQNRLVVDGWRPIELTWRMSDDEILDTLRAFGLAT